MALHRATDVDGPHACVRGRLAPSLPRLIAQDGKKGLPAMRQVHVQRRCSDQMMGSLTRSIEIGLLMLCSCQKSIECMQVVYVKVDENKPIVGAPSSFHAATRGIASQFFHIHRKTMPLYSFDTSRTHARPKSHVWSKMAKHQQKT